MVTPSCSTKLIVIAENEMLLLQLFCIVLIKKDYYHHFFLKMSIERKFQLDRHLMPFLRSHLKHVLLKYSKILYQIRQPFN